MNKFIQKLLSALAIPTAKDSEDLYIDLSSYPEGKPIGKNIILIDASTNDILSKTPYNNCANGLNSKKFFSDSFNNEIGSIQERMAAFLEQYGQFGGLDRYLKRPSDWWIDVDFYSTSRVLTVDLLNPKLQSLELISGIQNLLSELTEDWMILLTHDNSHDRYGRYVAKDGNYCIWITRKDVKVYSKLPTDIKYLAHSLKIATA